MPVLWVLTAMAVSNTRPKNGGTPAAGSPDAGQQAVIRD